MRYPSLLILTAAATALLSAAPVQAADTGLFLQELSRSGPTRFVQWVEQYYAERKQGKSGFQQGGEQTGAIVGALLGGSLGMLKDDMGQGIISGGKSGIENGKKIGSAYGSVYGRSPELEEIITDYINDRQPVLDDADAYVQSCMNSGQLFSACRRSQTITRLAAQISALNYQYCQKAVAVRQPGNSQQTILAPQLCQGK